MSVHLGLGSAPCSWVTVQPVATLPSLARAQVALEAGVISTSGLPAGELSLMTNSGLVFLVAKDEASVSLTKINGF